jgi:hypothetical protein
MTALALRAGSPEPSPFAYRWGGDLAYCRTMTFPALRILYPTLALAGLTFSVLLLIPFVRFRAVAQGVAHPRDFKLGEAPELPDWVKLPNRNYMNLLELPMLFYAVCITMYVTSAVDDTSVLLAWTYVLLRVAHSAIHLTYNHVVHRLVAFATSNVVLAILWLRLGLALAERAS